jgi:hypothetical protein
MQQYVVEAKVATDGHGGNDGGDWWRRGGHLCGVDYEVSYSLSHTRCEEYRKEEDVEDGEAAPRVGTEGAIQR